MPASSSGWETARAVFRLPGFPASHIGAAPLVAGDFDGDGRTDVILGGSEPRFLANVCGGYQRTVVVPDPRFRPERPGRSGPRTSPNHQSGFDSGAGRPRRIRPRPARRGNRHDDPRAGSTAVRRFRVRPSRTPRPRSAARGIPGSPRFAPSSTALVRGFREHHRSNVVGGRRRLLPAIGPASRTSASPLVATVVRGLRQDARDRSNLGLAHTGRPDHGLSCSRSRSLPRIRLRRGAAISRRSGFSQARFGRSTASSRLPAARPPRVCAHRPAESRVSRSPSSHGVLSTTPEPRTAVLSSAARMEAAATETVGSFHP